MPRVLVTFTLSDPWMSTKTDSTSQGRQVFAAQLCNAVRKPYLDAFNMYSHGYLPGHFGTMFQQRQRMDVPSHTPDIWITVAPMYDAHLGNNDHDLHRDLVARTRAEIGPLATKLKIDRPRLELELLFRYGFGMSFDEHGQLTGKWQSQPA